LKVTIFNGEEKRKEARMQSFFFFLKNCIIDREDSNERFFSFLTVSILIDEKLGI
jgi:hypothetical protein